MQRHTGRKGRRRFASVAVLAGLFAALLIGAATGQAETGQKALVLGEIMTSRPGASVYDVSSPAAVVVS